MQRIILYFSETFLHFTWSCQSIFLSYFIVSIYAAMYYFDSIDANTWQCSIRYQAFATNNVIALVSGYMQVRQFASISLLSAYNH
jgi:hypothetical protein